MALFKHKGNDLNKIIEISNNKKKLNASEQILNKHKKINNTNDEESKKSSPHSSQISFLRQSTDKIEEKKVQQSTKNNKESNKLIKSGNINNKYVLY